MTELDDQSSFRVDLVMLVEQLSSEDNLRPRTGDEIRRAFLTFFADRGHTVLPSSSLIPEDPTVLLTIAGMLPFKGVFLGKEEKPALRVTSSQKCIRTNDIDNVGRTARHHTFFEMLGNFSFGDYFKKEAIQWAWELSTEVFGLDPQKLVISIFREDDEAYEIWSNLIGVSANRIIRMDEADNFWSSGPTGPCGPCSELYYDFHPELGDEKIDLEDDSRFIEFYNLVFMEYNRNSAGQLSSLSQCNIDTGMGLERMAQILQGVGNNYETDLIFPLLQKASSIAHINYHKADISIQTSIKVIGDHTRALVQLISDGVLASNLGRGYVLRRLLRRVIRHGRVVGITKPFLVEMGDTAIHLMKLSYPQLLDRREAILKELQREELRFLETLERGEKRLEDLLASQPKNISGREAFELYDTYGFPLELTQEIAQEYSLKVDIDGFNVEMQKQRKRAKDASTSIDLTIKETIDFVAKDVMPTQFKGYDTLEETAVVQAIVANGDLVEQAVIGDTIQVLLDITTFYGEGGGQVGDKGILISDKGINNSCLIEIETVNRNQNAFIHTGIVRQGELKKGDVIKTKVDMSSRQRLKANHSATHLLQAALKSVVDKDISQAGSFVAFDRLRFDFNYPQAVSPQQIIEIEKLINHWIVESHPLIVKEMNIDKAKQLGAIAMFGEKYTDVVRVVDVPGVSMELCGGTHITNTSEIGVFKIISESGIAAGIRRIEAVSGQGVLDYLHDRDQVVKALSERFKAQPNEVVNRVLSLQGEVKSLTKGLQQAQDELANEKTLALVSEASLIGKNQLLVHRLDGISADALQNSAKALVDQLGSNSAVCLGGVPNQIDNDKVTLVVAFGPGLVATGFNAGKFIAPVARVCGGGGGGRPNLAQAGGRDSKLLNQALDFAENKLTQELR